MQPLVHRGYFHVALGNEMVLPHELPVLALKLEALAPTEKFVFV